MNQRMDSVDLWARKVRENKAGWKAAHTEFIDSQFQKADEFIKRLSKEKDGAAKIIEAYRIKNVEGYPALLKKSRSRGAGP